MWGMFPPWAEVELEPVNVTDPARSRRGRRPGESRCTGQHSTAMSGTIHRGSRSAPPGARWPISAITSPHVSSSHASIGRSLRTSSRHRPCETAATRRRHAVALRGLLQGRRAIRLGHRVGAGRGVPAAGSGGGAAPPTLNASVAGMRVDAIWHGERVAVELDGYRWHRTRTRQESDRQTRGEAAPRRMDAVALFGTARCSMNRWLSSRTSRACWPSAATRLGSSRSGVV